MSKFLHEFSKFPEQLYTPHNFKNVADAPPEVINIIQLIKSAVQAGSYSKASQLLTENKTLIAPYWIDADMINALEEEIYNMELYAKKETQCHYYCEDEPNGIEGDVWIA